MPSIAIIRIAAGSTAGDAWAGLKGMMAPVETAAEEAMIVDSRIVACDGGGRLGHPRVYLNMGDENDIVCPYCSRAFVLRDGAAEAPDH
jgi:uncharacterized Zn-finger protein